MKYPLAIVLLLASIVAAAAQGTILGPSANPPPLDANGWTIFTASTGVTNTNILYVSSSLGNDSTAVIGDITHPYQTIIAGLHAMRMDFPDWLLLKKGDTWSEYGQFQTRGFSATQPMVIGSYDPSQPGVVNPYTSKFAISSMSVTTTAPFIVSVTTTSPHNLDNRTFGITSIAVTATTAPGIIPGAGPIGAFLPFTALVTTSAAHGLNTAVQPSPSLGNGYNVSVYLVAIQGSSVAAYNTTQQIYPIDATHFAIQLQTNPGNCSSSCGVWQWAPQLMITDVVPKSVDVPSLATVGYNGIFPVIVTGASSFQYQISGNPGTVTRQGNWQYARPRLNQATGWIDSGTYNEPSFHGTVISGGQETGHYVVITGIEAYGFDRDPNNVNYNVGSTNSGLSFYGNGTTYTWGELEDNKISFYHKGMGMENTSGSAPSGSVWLRRNVFHDQYNTNIPPGDNSQSTGGLFGRSAVTVVESVYDHNGWNAVVPNAGPIGFSQNFTQGGLSPEGTIIGTPNGGVASSITATGTIFSNDGSSVIMESGNGTVSNNLFFHNNTNLTVGAAGLTGTIVSNNVFLNAISNSVSPGGGASTLNETVASTDNYNRSAIQFLNNIMANETDPTVNIGFNIGTASTPEWVGTVVDHNIIFAWPISFQAQAMYDSGTASVITNNWIDPVGTNSLVGNGGVAGTFCFKSTATVGTGNTCVTGPTCTGGPPGCKFPDPTRTVARYDAEVLGGPGTEADFLGQARLQSKTNWNPALTANAVNTYIRQGFGINSGPVFGIFQAHR